MKSHDLYPIVCICLGLFAFLYGLRIPPIHDREEYSRKYMELATGGAPDRSAQFRILRDVHLTRAYRIQNYGLSAVALGVFGMVLLRWRALVRWLAYKRIRVFLLGVYAATIAVGTYVGALFLDMARGEFPMWADSLGIPLMSVPLLFCLAIVWMILNWAMCVPSLVNRFKFELHGLGWWFAVLSMLTVVLLIWSLVVGDFWSLIAAPPWLLLYVVIWLSRTQKNA